jgi:hypothetical protein
VKDMAPRGEEGFRRGMERRDGREDRSEELAEERGEGGGHEEGGGLEVLNEVPEGGEEHAEPFWLIGVDFIEDEQTIGRGGPEGFVPWQAVGGAEELVGGEDTDGGGLEASHAEFGGGLAPGVGRRILLREELGVEGLEGFAVLEGQVGLGKMVAKALAHGIEGRLIRKEIEEYGAVGTVGLVGGPEEGGFRFACAGGGGEDSVAARFGGSDLVRIGHLEGRGEGGGGKREKGTFSGGGMVGENEGATEEPAEEGGGVGERELLDVVL